MGHALGQEQAFPRDGQEGESAHPGMTMRQYYKAAALPGIIAAYASQGVVHTGEIAAECAKHAEAQIAEDEEHAKANP